MRTLLKTLAKLYTVQVPCVKTREHKTVKPLHATYVDGVLHINGVAQVAKLPTFGVYTEDMEREYTDMCK